MTITQEQLELISKFRSVRISEVDAPLLKSIKGIVIGGTETSLAKLFRSSKNVSDDAKDIVASYVVLSPENVVLVFYSLRCGELYRQVDIQKMVLCSNAWQALNQLINNPPKTKNEHNLLLSAINDARRAGISSPDEWKRFHLKKIYYIGDKNLWSGSNIEQVSEVLPGIELKYFGSNENAKVLWSSYCLPKRMGETLFWQCTVSKIEEICQKVGCQYLYLFAADNKPDGNLVGYYNTRLGFEKDSDLNANKPHFDFKCRFMCQDIDTLRKNKAYFLDHFNSKEK